MDMRNLHKDLKGVALAFKMGRGNIIPRIIAQEGQNHFEDSWRKRGFEDQGVKKWKKRKAPKRLNADGTVSKAYREWRRKEGRALLVSHQTDTEGNHLKDSVKNRISRGRVTFSSDKVYAKVHNEGGRAGRGKGFKMPKRQFMGHSHALDKKIFTKLDREIGRLIK